MNGAGNLTEDCETSSSISIEPHVITPSRVDCDSTIKEMCYGETVSLRGIIVHYMDDNVLAH